MKIGQGEVRFKKDVKSVRKDKLETKKKKNMYRNKKSKRQTELNGKEIN